jgi:glutaredoxin 3
MLTVYSKNNCPFCIKAKNLLESKGIAFTEIKVDEDASAREFLVTAGHKTVPQIYKDGEVFIEGGYNGLAKLSQQELMERIGA